PRQLRVLGQQSIQRRHVARADEGNSPLEELVDVHEGLPVGSGGYPNLADASRSVGLSDPPPPGSSAGARGDVSPVWCTRGRRRFGAPAPSQRGRSDDRLDLPNPDRTRDARPDGTRQPHPIDAPGLADLAPPPRDPARRPGLLAFALAAAV